MTVHTPEKTAQLEKKQVYLGQTIEPSETHRYELTSDENGRLGIDLESEDYRNRTLVVTVHIRPVSFEEPIVQGEEGEYVYDVQVPEDSIVFP